MAEYIDRDNFLKKLGEVYPGIPPHGAIIVGMLCDEEPADVRPVVRGRWEVTPVYIKCSECSDSFPLIPQNFCPACGADMREG